MATSGIGGFLSSMSPETRDALIKAGLGGIGSYYSNKAAEGKNRQDLGSSRVSQANTNQLNARENALARRSTDFDSRRAEVAGDFTEKNRQIDAADRLVSDKMGASPLDFANQRGNMMARAEMYSKPMVPNYLRAQVPSFIANGLSPQTIAMMTPTPDKEKGYWDAVAMAGKGRFQGPNLEGSYGAEGSAIDDAIKGTSGKSGDLFSKTWGDYEQDRESSWDTYEKDRNTRLDEMVGLSDSQKKEAIAFMNGVEELAKKEGGGGFWSKVGGIIKVVGPIAAMALPMIGPAVAVAIAAGSAGGGTALQGGSVAQSLGAAGVGAAAQGLIGGFGGKSFVDKDVANVASRIYPT